MIFGKPTNLWLGLMTAVVGAVEITLIAFGFDPTIVATVGGAWGAVGGALIVLVASRPPTLAPGDTFNTLTPAGEPNFVTVVATPPAPSTPVQVEPAPNPADPQP